MIFIVCIKIIPIGINHNLCFHFPGYAQIKEINNANSDRPLQGSPIHNPFVPSIPIVLIVGLLPAKTGNPNFFRMNKLQFELSFIIKVYNFPS